MQRIGILSAVILFIAGCSTPPLNPTSAAPPSPTATANAAIDTGNDQKALYLAAIRQAAVPTEAAVFDGLVALTREGGSPLVWESDAATARVKMVSVMSEASYQKYYASVPANQSSPPSWGIMWVTAAPQLQKFCATLPGDAESKTNRIKQWLGLAPTGSYARVVELWVAPTSLARPCPDNEVTDRTCQLDKGDPKQPTAEPDYATWFTGWYRVSYREGGYPWTHLGYTYDWAPPTDTANPTRPVGASEFILRPNAPYTIIGGATIGDYCQSSPPAVASSQ